MKIIGEYLTGACRFDHLASEEESAQVRAVLKQQAAAYRRHAVERAKGLGLELPDIEN